MGTENLRDYENIYEYMVENLSAELIRENLDLLSDDGSSRDVYALSAEFIKENLDLLSDDADTLSNSIVVKLAKNEHGKEQNQTEDQVYKQVLEYQDMMDDEILSDIAGIYEDHIRPNGRRATLARNLKNILATVYAISNNDEILLMERLVKSGDSSVELEDHSITLLIERFSLHSDDIQSEGSWICDEDNNSKLVDYGCTKELADRMDWGVGRCGPQDEDE